MNGDPAMRKVIPASDPDRPPFVVASDEVAGSIVFEADGQAVRIGPDEARRIGRALIQAASLVEHAIRAADGGGSAPDF